jgi:lysophospholipase L1-like esterase
MAVLLLASAVPGARAAEDAACPASSVPPITVPLSHKALDAHQELLVVALGSSSTQSWMSSDPGHSYPAILQRRLNELLPGAHVAVINRGIAGEDAAEELTRIDRDVVAVRPSMVIWQVGANGVLKSVDPVVYKRLVTDGVDRMEKAHIDVVLMDNQRSPALEASPEQESIDRATAEVAAATGAGLFSRSALMAEWQREGASYDRFISPDRMHHNDLGYRCVANAMAGAIAAGLGPDRVAVAHPGEGVPAGAATR